MGVVGKVRVISNRYRVSFWGDESVVKLTVVMVTQLYEHSKSC